MLQEINFLYKTICRWIHLFVTFLGTSYYLKAVQ